jgi:hypothetical protein
VYLPTTDYTASNGTTVVLNNGCTTGDTVTVESFLVSSVLNAIPNSPASVGSSNIVAGAVGTTQLASGSVTQSILGTNVAGNGPAFSAYPSAAVSCANVTQTLMTCNTVIYNLGGCYNNTGSTTTLNGLSVPAYSFCPNVAGYYLVTTTTFLVASTGSIQTQAFKNGSLLLSASCPNISNGVGPSITNLVYLNGTGDYVQFYTYQTSGSTVSTLANRSDLIGFQASMVRAA